MTKYKEAHQTIADMDEVATKQKSRFITPVSIFISVAISCFAVGLIVAHISSGKPLSPNEWGDYFAGFAGSLALVWLVAGFLLQRIELGQNTRILRMQAAELDQNTQALEDQAKQLTIAAAEARRSNEISALVELLKTTEKQIKAFSQIEPHIGQLKNNNLQISLYHPVGDAPARVIIDSSSRDIFENFDRYDRKGEISWSCIINPKKLKASNALISVIMIDTTGISKSVIFSCEIDGPPILKKPIKEFCIVNVINEIDDLHTRYAKLLNEVDMLRADEGEVKKLEEPPGKAFTYYTVNGPSTIWLNDNK